MTFHEKVCEMKTLHEMSFRAIDRFCRRDNACFRSERHGAFHVYRFHTSESARAMEVLLDGAEELIKSGKVYKPGSRGYAVRVEIDGKSYFLKSYDCRSFTYRVRNAFRKSRGVTTWCSNWKMYSLGLPVPLPLLCIEERHFRLLGRSYLLTECFEDTCNLEQAWMNADEDKRADLLKKSAGLISVMHERGVIHGDLKWNNFLVDSRKADGKVYLVDLDGSTFYSGFSEKRARKDLNRFVEDLRKNASDENSERIFLKSWQEGVRL